MISFTVRAWWLLAGVVAVVVCVAQQFWSLESRRGLGCLAFVVCCALGICGGCGVAVGELSAGVSGFGFQ